MRAASGPSAAPSPSPSPAPPRVHLFVCANRRESSPLGPGCGERGDAVYEELKREVGTQRRIAEVWVTKTHCLGICPKRGATVARYGAGVRGAIVAGVETGDAVALLSADADADASEEADADADASEEADASVAWEDVARELADLEELQTKKVLELARRLKPGLTLEDVQNPHDFPELDDADWHYADGILTGMKSVTSALRALWSRRRARTAGGA